jgi:Holliday junction resolvasome RuvABC DNA-binding subunit
MIAFIHGELTDSALDSVTVRVGGIGLRVAVPSNVINEIGAVGDAVTLATRLLCETIGWSSLAFPQSSKLRSSIRCRP